MYTLTELTQLVSEILEVFSSAPSCLASGSPSMALDSIVQADLKSVGLLARVDLGRFRAWSVRLDPPTQALSSAPPPTLGVNIVIACELTSLSDSDMLFAYCKRLGLITSDNIFYKLLFRLEDCILLL